MTNPSWTSENLDAIMTLYLDRQRAAKRREEWGLDGHGPTDKRCQAIIVGERPNKNSWKVSYTGRALGCSPSGEYLDGMLRWAGLRPEKTYWVNAIQASGYVLSKTDFLWAVGLNIPVVALGNLAAKVLDDADIRCIYADHPHYTKRFFHKCSRAMGDWLRKELEAWPQK